MHRLSAVLSVCLVCLATVPGALAQGRPAGVETQIIETTTSAETITVFGEVVAGRESDVATRVGGLVVRVPVRVGDRVQEGAVLAEMDAELLRLELARAEASLAVAEAGVDVAEIRADRAERAFRRAENLSRNATISDAQLDDRAGDFAEAQGALREARARVVTAQSVAELARYDVENALVRAPFDGIVIEVFAQVGEFTSTGTQIAALLDTAEIEVEANVPARVVAALEPGRRVAAETDTGGALELALRAVLPTEVSTTRTRPVRFEMTVPDATVAVGQPVTLQIPVGAAREVVVVPKDALIQGQGGWTAFVNTDGKASPRTVEIGQAVGDGFEVVSGLQAGDEVVVRGNERLRPGQDIAPMGAGGPPAMGGGRPPAAGGGDGAPSDDRGRAQGDDTGRAVAATASSGG